MFQKKKEEERKGAIEIAENLTVAETDGVRALIQAVSF